MKNLKTLIEELAAYELTTDAKLDLLTAIQIACFNDEIYQAATQVRDELPVEDGLQRQDPQGLGMAVRLVNGTHISGLLLEENSDEKLRASDSEIMTDYVKNFLA